MNKSHLVNFLKITVLLLVSISFEAFSQTDVPYQDLTHQSKVFGHEKYYRLYLPREYRTSQKRFPVVYFFHGWGGRHFKDESAKLDYVKLQELVDQYHIIMVMWDGNMDLKEPRPYNVGNHEDVKFQVQMKDYFPELVKHIDDTYRTISNRDNRSIIGFSMGGFMALFLAGKYPDMVSAMVSMMGSPEFFVGTPTNQTLYPIRYTFENLQDLKVRIHTSPTDILYYLNQEVKAGARWEGKEIEMEEFPGGHMVDIAGKTDVFEKAMEFVSKEMGKSHPAPTRWSHYDVYGTFDLWGYEVQSDKDQPGFIYLKDVTKNGFEIYTKKWLPNGPAVEIGTINVTTAPIYKPGTVYQTAIYQFKTRKVILADVKADSKGRIALKLDANGSKVGIFEDGDQPAWTYLDYEIDQRRSFKEGLNKLKINIFNRGGNGSVRPYVMVNSLDDDIHIANPGEFTKTGQTDNLAAAPIFTVMCNKRPPLHAEPAQAKLEITIHDGERVDTSIISIPVDFDVRYFTHVKVDDAKLVRGAALGKGNGDGKLNGGEDVLLYKGAHRLRIYSEDPGIDNAKEQFTDEMIPARWPDGFTQNSIIHISPDVKEGQEIECLASYETKTFNPIERKVIWGRVKLRVYATDTRIKHE